MTHPTPRSCRTATTALVTLALTAVALLAPAPATATVSTPQVAAGAATGLPVGTTHVTLADGEIDFRTEALSVAFDYVINPAVTEPTSIRVIVWKGFYVYDEQAAVDTVTVSTNGRYAKVFNLPAGPYTVDIQTAVEGQAELVTYNSRLYEGEVTENTAPPTTYVAYQPQEIGNNKVIITNNDPDHIVYYDVNTNEVLTGEVSTCRPDHVVINVRKADPNGNYTVTSNGPWTYVCKTTPTPTPTPEPTTEPTVAPTTTTTPAPAPTGTQTPPGTTPAGTNTPGSTTASAGRSLAATGAPEATVGLIGGAVLLIAGLLAAVIYRRRHSATQ